MQRVGVQTELGQEGPSASNLLSQGEWKFPGLGRSSNLAGQQIPERKPGQNLTKEGCSLSMASMGGGYTHSSCQEVRALTGICNQDSNLGEGTY